jgi:nitric oxide reductase subunit B
MTAALLIAGYEQSFIERAVGGSTWSAYFAAQTHPWFVQGMVWRNIFGFVTAIGLGILVWDLLTLGRGEQRIAAMAESQEDPETDLETAPAPA